MKRMGALLKVSLVNIHLWIGEQDIVVPVKDQLGKNIAKVIIQAMQYLPAYFVKTITFDIGKEF